MIAAAKEIKKITIKSPSIPIFLPEAGKGRQGGIFKTLKYY